MFNVSREEGSTREEISIFLLESPSVHRGCDVKLLRLHSWQQFTV